MGRADLPAEAWGPTPDREPPSGTTWVGEWSRSQYWDTSMGDDDWLPIWSREALKHDGHEECCAHTRFVYAPAPGVSYPDDDEDVTP